MKALKTIGMVVAVVGLAATGIGLALGGAAATGTFLDVSAATFMTVGTVAGLAAGAIGVASAVFAPKPGFSSQGNPLQFQTNPQSGLPYPIGRTRMSGLRIHGDTYDAPAFKSESKQDILSFAVMLGAGGPMEELETFRVDKETVTFDGSGNAVGRFADYMAQKVSLGVAGASALALAFGGGSFPGWTADHKLSGIAHALWDLRYDAKGERFGAGVPEPEWIGKWVKVYDPRKDSTYPGGSGSHRALDESTYEWSANPALHGLTWALGRWQNGKRTLGIGAPIANIRISDFVEAANVADANGWTCGGVEWSTDSKWAVLKRMLQAGGAEPTTTGAMIGCRVNTPRVPVATITADQLLDKLSIATTRSRRDRFNTVIPRYRSEDHDWQVISGTPVSVSAYVTADAGVRTKEIDFPLVQAETGGSGDDQAGQLAAYEIVNSREAGPIVFTTGPELIGIKTGDVVTLDVPEEGLDAVDVLVRKVRRDPGTLKLTFEGESETSAKHPFALGQTTTPPPPFTPSPPDLTPPTPDAGLWSLTAVLAGDAVPAIVVAGACEFPGADAVLIEYRKVGDADWLTVGKAEASAPVNQVISGLEPLSSYEARLAYQSGPRAGDWLDLGPVTTPARPPLDVPTSIRQASVGNWRTSLSVPRAPLIASDAGASASISVAKQDWDYPGTSPVITRVVGTITGLPFDTVHYIFFDDATLANATPTYQATTDPALGQNSSAHPDRHPIGMIRTPKDGGADIEGGIGPNYGYGELTDAVANFGDRLERLATTPTAPTLATDGSAVEHNASKLGVNLRLAWTYSAGDEALIHGFEVMLYQAAANTAYTPGTTPLVEQRTLVGPKTRGLVAFVADATAWDTWAIRSYRNVDKDVDASGRIYSAWIKPAGSGEDPYQPSSSAELADSVKIGSGGNTASNVSTWAAYASAGLNSDGTVKDAKVGTAALIDYSLIKAGWAVQTATTGITNETYDMSFGSPLTTSGPRLVLRGTLIWRLAVTNPTQDAEWSFDVKGLLVQTVSPFFTFTTQTQTLTYKWLWSSRTGTFYTEKRSAAFEWVVDGQTLSTYQPGMRFVVPAGFTVEIVGAHYLKIDDVKVRQ